MGKPFFSIIIPSYNRASIIRKTIESALNQSFKNIEIIVVDDGSTDNTRDVVSSINDNRIKYVYQDNAERCVARNNGASYAQGEYLLFLDSDDSYETNHLKGLFDFIEKQNHKEILIVCHCRYHIINQEGEHIEYPTHKKIIEGQEFEYVLFIPLITSRICLHRKIFEEFQFDTHINISEDQILWISIATKYKIVQYEQYTVNYTIHENNSVSLKNNPYIQRLSSLKRLFYHKDYSFVQSRIKVKQRNFILAECYFNIAKCHRLNGERLKTSIALIKSFFIKPNYRNKERLYMLLK